LRLARVDFWFTVLIWRGVERAPLSGGLS